MDIINSLCVFQKCSLHVLQVHFLQTAHVRREPPLRGSGGEGPEVLTSPGIKATWFSTWFCFSYISGLYFKVRFCKYS